MRITKTSILTGKTHTLEIDITQEQIDAWQGGELIQRVMSHLGSDEREFLISGTTQAEWDEYYKEG